MFLKAGCIVFGAQAGNTLSTLKHFNGFSPSQAANAAVGEREMHGIYFVFV